MMSCWRLTTFRTLAHSALTASYASLAEAPSAISISYCRAMRSTAEGSRGGEALCGGLGGCMICAGRTGRTWFLHPEIVEDVAPRLFKFGVVLLADVNGGWS